jgi:peptide/nickel transport system permease protein
MGGVQDMIRFMIERVFGLLGVLFVISIVTFVIMHAIPGGPFDIEQMPLSPDAVALVKAKYGLDRPLYEQYAKYMWSALHGDLGTPFQSPSETVAGLIGRTWKTTAVLGATAMVLAYVIGIPLGLVAAVNQNTWIDYVATVLAVLGVVLPSFVVAMLLILVFSQWFSLVPTGGWGESWRQALLPVIAYSFSILPIVARYVRSTALEVLRSDFVRTARAKGLSQRAVLQRHVLRNTLTPLVTITGPLLAWALTGSFFIETIFRIPGMGLYFTKSALERDYPMIMALTLLFAVVITLVYLISDLAYAWIDPRVRIH